MSQTNQKNLEEIIPILPSYLKQELENYARYLLDQEQKISGSAHKRNLSLDWAGALRDLSDQFTAVDLQHKTLEWWDDDVSS